MSAYYFKFSCCDSKRTCRGLQLSMNTIKKYVSMSSSGISLETPGKVRKRAKPKRDVDSFTQGAVRGLVYEYHRMSKNAIISFYIILPDLSAPTIYLSMHFISEKAITLRRLMAKAK